MGFDVEGLALEMIGAVRAPMLRVREFDPKLSDQLREASQSVVPPRLTFHE